VTTIWFRHGNKKPGRFREPGCRSKVSRSGSASGKLPLRIPVFLNQFAGLLDSLRDVADYVIKSANRWRVLD
jgi:hypothetical protein